MPVYEYACPQGNVADWFNAVDNRHTQAPVCNCCNVQMTLLISAVSGVVKFPAAGGQEYVSTTTGRHITTERARRDDLARSGCRPYEGFEQENKEAARWREHKEKQSDGRLHESVARAYHQLSPKERRILETGGASTT